MRAQTEQQLLQLFNTAGYTKFEKITDTLQGSIWRSYKQSSNQNVVIKVTNKDLHSKSVIVVDGLQHKIHENIVQEKSILKYLTKKCKKCPNSVVKYVDFLRCNYNHYLIMEDGGPSSLFDFTVKVHKIISAGNMSIKSWQKTVKVIFKQMIECIEYIHSKNVAHFDLSLENFLINDVRVFDVNNGQQIAFYNQYIQITLCDFGLAEFSTDPQFICKKFCGKLNYKSPEVTEQNKPFSAKKNDIWCMGVCLFMMIIGSSPWVNTCPADESFSLIMNGELKYLLNSWNKNEYINNNLSELFLSFFQFENTRITMKEIKDCKWLNEV